MVANKVSLHSDDRPRSSRFDVLATAKVSLFAVGHLRSESSKPPSLTVSNTAQLKGHITGGNVRARLPRRDLDLHNNYPQSRTVRVRGHQPPGLG